MVKRLLLITITVLIPFLSVADDATIVQRNSYDLQEAHKSVTLQIYTLKYADTASIKDTLLDIYSNDNSIRIAASRNKLFIRASEQQHKEIKNLLKELDVRQKNVRIDVKFSGTGDNSDIGAGITGHGKVIYGNGDISGNVAVNPSIHSSSTHISETSTQTLMVMSGAHAELRVGTRVPYLNWIMEYGYHHGFIAGNIQWENVGSFLSVEPDIIGEGPMVKVRLVPVLSGLVDGHRERIRFTEEATEVVVRSGNTVTIGGASNSRQFLSHFLVGFDKSGRSYALNISLKPTIMN